MLCERSRSHNIFVWVCRTKVALEWARGHMAVLRGLPWRECAMDFSLTQKKKVSPSHTLPPPIPPSPTPFEIERLAGILMRQLPRRFALASSLRPSSKREATLSESRQSPSRLTHMRMQRKSAHGQAWEVLLEIDDAPVWARAEVVADAARQRDLGDGDVSTHAAAIAEHNLAKPKAWHEPSGRGRGEWWWCGWVEREREREETAGDEDEEGDTDSQNRQ